MRTPLKYCPKCAEELRVFGDGRKTGRACPKCGAIYQSRLPSGYCLGVLGAVILGLFVAMAYLPALVGSSLVFGGILLIW